MKKAAWILCCVLTANLLCGCSPRFLPQPKDISNVELVRTLAVDSAPEERVKVTVSSGVKQEESGSGGKEPLILEREAGTVFGRLSDDSKERQWVCELRTCDRVHHWQRGGGGRY